tara:strand:+ start:333 stop:458 length:126 start_codon:yes stop_codon:yes gene_type:complete
MRLKKATRPIGRRLSGEANYGRIEHNCSFSVQVIQAKLEKI